MKDARIIVEREGEKIPIRRKEYQALQELKKTNPIPVNADHIFSFAEIEDGRVTKVNLLEATDLQKHFHVLRHLTAVKELKIWETNVKDLSPLQHLKNLRKLVLSADVKDLSPLGALKNLRHLHLVVEAKKLTFLKDLKKLNTLKLYCEEVEEFLPLGSLKSLQDLTVQFTKPNQDLSFFKNLQNLRKLDVFEDISEADLSPIGSVKKLEYLSLTGTHISDLSPIARLTNLNVLEISDARVSNLSPLKHLENLKELELAHTDVRDLSPLRHLKNLRALRLAHLNISDLSPLRALENLKRLEIDTSGISEEDLQILSDMEGLTVCLDMKKFTF